MSQVERVNKARALLGIAGDVEVGDSFGDATSEFMVEVAKRIVALENSQPVSMARPVGVDRGLGFTIDPADWVVWFDAEDGLIHATPVNNASSVKA